MYKLYMNMYNSILYNSSGRVGKMYIFLSTVCPGSSDPFNVVIYYIKWITTSWTYSIYILNLSVYQ